jgi:hypothetical protein
MTSNPLLFISVYQRTCAVSLEAPFSRCEMRARESLFTPFLIRAHPRPIRSLRELQAVELSLKQ